MCETKCRASALQIGICKDIYGGYNLEKIDILENKLTNLIPVINPGLKNENGIRAAILYRVCPSIEVDSSKVVREAYEKFYGKDIPESADTIFNALKSRLADGW